MDTRNFMFMFYGFLAAWVIVLGYVMSIAMRENKLRRELDRVRRMFEERETENSRPAA